MSAMTLPVKIYTQYWPVGDEGMVMQNPYWINYRNLRQNKKDRYMLNAGLSYKILDWLTVSGRVRLDNSNNDYTEKVLCFYQYTAHRELFTRSLWYYQDAGQTVVCRLPGEYQQIFR